MTPEEIAAAIRQLTAVELVELGKHLHDDDGWWETAAVPAKPSPESPGDSVALGLPADYGETAE